MNRDDDDLVAELKRLISDASGYLSKFERARDDVLRLVRDVIKLSSRAVLEVERGRGAEAEELIEQGAELLSQLKEAADKFEDLRRYLRDGERELFEAILTFKFLTGREPRATSIEIPHAAKVAALFDFAGELKRIFYSSLLDGDVRMAERALKCAEEIYASLAASDITNASVHDFKFKLDALRKQVEVLKRDLFFFKMEQWRDVSRT